MMYADDTAGRITAECVSRMSADANRVNRGIISAANGTIIDSNKAW